MSERDEFTAWYTTTVGTWGDLTRATNSYWVSQPQQPTASYQTINWHKTKWFEGTYGPATPPKPKGWEGL
jgi:hypothetical protein